MNIVVHICICKLKRHIEQVHKELSEEESLAILLRSKLSKKVDKQYYFLLI